MFYCKIFLNSSYNIYTEGYRCAVCRSIRIRVRPSCYLGASCQNTTRPSREVKQVFLAQLVLLGCALSAEPLASGLSASAAGAVLAVFLLGLYRL
jgi:hypothetical protein